MQWMWLLEWYGYPRALVQKCKRGVHLLFNCIAHIPLHCAYVWLRGTLKRSRGAQTFVLGLRVGGENLAQARDHACWREKDVF